MTNHIDHPYDDPDDHGAFDDAVYAAFLAFEERLNHPHAGCTLPMTLDIPIKYVALLLWTAERLKLRMAGDTALPDGDFSFNFSAAEWAGAAYEFENILNNIYEDQVHALNNGFDSLLTSLSKNERDASTAMADAKP